MTPQQHQGRPTPPFAEVLHELYLLVCSRNGWNPEQGVFAFESEGQVAHGSVEKVFAGERGTMGIAAIERLLEGLYDEGDGVLSERDRAEWSERLHVARATTLIGGKLVTDVNPALVNVPTRFQAAVADAVTAHYRENPELWGRGGLPWEDEVWRAYTWSGKGFTWDDEEWRLDVGMPGVPAKKVAVRCEALDEGAFMFAFRCEMPHLLRYGAAALGDKTGHLFGWLWDAVDIGWKALPSYEPTRMPLRPWLYRVAVKAVRAYAREQGRREIWGPGPWYRAPWRVRAPEDKGDYLTAESAWDEMWDAINALPAAARTVLQLYGAAGLSYGEIAHALGKTEQDVLRLAAKLPPERFPQKFRYRLLGEGLVELQPLPSPRQAPQEWFLASSR